MSLVSQEIFSFSSSKVKSICFHRSASVVIVGYYSGVVQSWDYNLGIPLVDFVGHRGPVRCVAFHSMVDMFATGGDDTKVRLWDYAEKKCVKVFSHRDYVRSVSFHTTKPWLLSTSDDMTVKVWDIQARKLVSTLAGHTNYVMCGGFLENKIVSGSLDETVRVWKNPGARSGVFKLAEISELTLDAHDKCVNCISVCGERFVTGSDDRSVKIWKLKNQDVIFEKCINSHSRGVTGVFLDKKNLLSVGEDGVLSITNEKGTIKETGTERYWCVSGRNDESEIYAAGHDQGFLVFSTKQKEKFAVSEGSICYVRSGNVYKNDLKSEEVMGKIDENFVGLSLNKEQVIVEHNDSYTLMQNRRSQRDFGKAKFLGDYFITEKNLRIVVEFEKKIVGEITGESLVPTDLNFVKGTQENIAERNSCLEGKTQPMLFTRVGGSISAYSVGEKLSFVYAVRDFLELEKVLVSEDAIGFIGKRDVKIYNRDFSLKHEISEKSEILGGYFSSVCRKGGDGFKPIFIYATSRQLKFACINENEMELGVLQSIYGFVPFCDVGDMAYGLVNGRVERYEIDFSELELKFEVLEYFVCKRKSKSSENKEDCKKAEMLKESIEEKVYRIPGSSVVSLLKRRGLGYSCLGLVGGLVKAEIFLENDELIEALKHSSQNEEILERIAERGLALGNKTSLLVAEECLKKIHAYEKLFMLYLCTKNEEGMDYLLKSKAAKKIKMACAIIRKDKGVIKRVLKGEEIEENAELEENKKRLENIIEGSESITEEREPALKKSMEEIPVDDDLDWDEAEAVEEDEKKENFSDLIFLLTEEKVEPKNYDSAETLKSLVVDDIPEEDVILTLNSAIEDLRKGKSKNCINLMRGVLRKMVSTGSYSEEREAIGNYLRALLAEKFRRKSTDEQSMLECATEFFSTPKRKEFQLLATKSYTKVLEDIENYKTLKTLGIDKGDTDKLKIREGSFCLDLKQNSSNFKECRACKSKFFSECIACEIKEK